MEGVNRFERRDWLMAALLFGCGVALHAPFRSALAYHWDSAQFTLAVRDYNMALSQPHAPGYFLYVMLGRLVNFFAGDPHTSLVWLSLLAGAALAAVMYLLGTAMFDRRAGVVAGWFGLTSPQVWFHSCVALTYVVDGFLVCAFVLWCWLAMRRGGTWLDAVALGVLASVIAGVRLQTLPALVPLAAWTFWRFERARLRKGACAAAVFTLMTAAWFLPMLGLSGGWPVYSEMMRRTAELNSPLTLSGGGAGAFVQNCAAVFAFCWNGMMLALPLPLFARLRGREHGTALMMLALWLVPMLVMATAIAFTRQPGFVLSYLSALLLLAAVAVSRLRSRLHFIVVAGAVCAVNAATFVAWPAKWDGVLFGVGRTAREIHQHDQRLTEIVAMVRSRYQPADTIVYHAMEHYLYGVRLFQLYLPEFDQYQMWRDTTVVTPVERSLWRVRGGRLEFVENVEFAGKRRVLLVVPPGQTLSIYRPYLDVGQARAVGGSAGTLFEVNAEVTRP